MDNNLQILIDNTANGEVLTLSSDIVIESTAIVSKELTIDLNGYTIKNATDIWNSTAKNWSLISVRENGNLTIVDNSELQDGTLLAKENDCYAIDVQDNGVLTIENGNYIGNCSSVYVKSGTAYINGGYYKIQQLSTAGNEYGETINCYDANYANGTAKVIINGGAFYKFDPTNAAEPSECEQSYLPTDSKMAYDETTGTYVVVADNRFKVVATTSAKVDNLPIKNGQLVFVRDTKQIAFDFKGNRVIYGNNGEEIEDIYTKINTLLEKDIQLETKIDEKITEVEAAIAIVEF